MKATFSVMLGVLILFVPPAFAQPSGADSQTKDRGQEMMAGGMMGDGMMGRGMMGSSSDSDQATSANSKEADALLGYIRSKNLPCSQCHGVSRNGFGPSFTAVSGRYANDRDASAILTNHIANGFGRMPGGFATDSEAKELARLILSLAKSGNQ